MYTIADLPVDNRLQTVNYNLELESALRRMFENGYTQIGVERDDELVGIVTADNALTLLKKETGIG